MESKGTAIPIEMPQEAWQAWLDTRVILSKKRQVFLMLMWGFMSFALFVVLVLDYWMDGYSGWTLYYAVLGAGEAWAAQRNYAAWRIIRLREKNPIPEWLQGMLLSYWVWDRDQRREHRKQQLAGIAEHMGKGIGLDRRR